MRKRLSVILNIGVLSLLGSWTSHADSTLNNLQSVSARPAFTANQSVPATEHLSPTGVTNGTGANDTPWFDDAPPVGAALDASGGDSWNWTSSSPAPYSGSFAHQSGINAG